jgi:hypothetical protein
MVFVAEAQRERGIDRRVEAPQHASHDGAAAGVQSINRLRRQIIVVLRTWPG